MREVARYGDAAPDGDGIFTSFTAVSLNNLGQLAFRGSLENTSQGDANGEGMFLAENGQVTRIVREGQLTPDGIGTFAGFDSGPSLNNQGDVAFRSGVNAFSGNQTSGLFFRRQNSLVNIAYRVQQVPGSERTFDSFQMPAISDSRVVAFAGGRAVGPTSDPTIGEWLVLGDGEDLVTVAREGTVIGGAPIQFLRFANGVSSTRPRGSGASGVNDRGQVAFATNSEAGTLVALFTPELHWRRRSSSGFWTSSDNWTLGLSPNVPHEVFIDPDVTVSVLGPDSDTTIRLLEVGGNTGLATLTLRSGRITVNQGVVVRDTGRLAGDGVIEADVVNEGTINAGNVNVLGTITNHGLIHGSGRIAGAIETTTTGEVRSMAGSRLELDGPLLTNHGLINALGSPLSHSEIEFLSPVTNESDGDVFARDAALRFNGGLINRGTVGFSFGTSDVFGAIDNAESGLIVVSGESNATFFGNVHNDGEIRTSGGSTSVFFGDISGDGPFTGEGTTHIEGNVAPGNSPGVISFEGDVVLSGLAHVMIEISGSATAGEYDQLNVASTISLGGTLEVLLIDNYQVDAGDQFDIINAGGISNTFDSLNFPDLNEGFAWSLRYGEQNVSLEVLSELNSGDYDGNGFVNQADLDLVLLNWGARSDEVVGWSFNRPDGIVDQDELDEVLLNWGLGDATSVDEVFVPEPATWILALSLITCAAIAQHQRRRCIIKLLNGDIRTKRLVAPKTTRLLICAWGCIATLSVLTPKIQGQVTLTGLFESSTGQGQGVDDLDDFSGGHVWNTIGGDGSHNLWLIGGFDLEGEFVNGPLDDAAPINVTLSSGTHRFTVFGAPGLDLGKFGLNLFFNGDGQQPGITVLADTATSSAEPFPPVRTSSGMTSALDGSQTPGAGTLSFSTDDTMVELVDYRWFNPTVFGIDRVGRFEIVPDGQADFIGQFELIVESLPSSLPIPGDYDGSRVIDQTDLDIVLLFWGNDAESTPTFDGLPDVLMGRVDQDDLDKVLLNWGLSETDLLAPVAAAAPEPASSVIAGLLLLAAYVARWWWKSKNCPAILVCLVVVTFGVRSTSADIRAIAVAGQPAPVPGDLNYGTVSLVPGIAGMMDGGGDIYFRFNLVGEDVTVQNDEGLWIDRGDVPELIAREGTLPPELPPGSISDYFKMIEPLENGVVVETPFGLTLWRASESGFERIVSGGDPAPGTDEVFIFGFEADFAPNGHFAFLSYVPSGNEYDTGIWADRGNGLEIIAQSRTLPDGSAFSGISAMPRINSAGTLLMRASVDGSPALLADQSGAIAPIATVGDVVDGSDAHIQTISDTRINETGTIVFSAILGGDNVHAFNDHGIVRHAADGLSFVAREDQAFTFDGETNLHWVSLPERDMALNDADQLAILAGVRGKGITGDNDEGIWLAQQESFTLLASEGDEAVTRRKV